MAIAPISVGDKDARLKMNEAIAKANLVDSKADIASLAAEAVARVAGLAGESAARRAGLEAEAVARRADLLALPLPMPVQHRPGDAPLEFGRSLADGEAAGVAPLSDTLLRYDEAGKVVRLTGDDIIAPRHLYALEPGRRYLATFAVQRRVNSPDPDNDAIRCAFAWYGQGKGRLLTTPQTVAQDLLGLTTGSGRQVVRAVVSRAAGADVDIVAPDGARYVRPFVQTFGTLVQNDVEVVGWVDITDVVAFAPDVSALEGRIAAVESIDAGDRLDVVEAAIAAPNTVRFKTVGDLVAGSPPVIVDAIEVLGFAAPGDGGGHRRRRVAIPSSATVVDADGYLWEIAEPVVTPEMVGGDLQLSMDAAAAIGAKWRASPKLYAFSQIVIPDGLHLSAAGATFRHDGSSTGVQFAVTFGNGVRFDQLGISTPGTETAIDLVKIGDGVIGSLLFVTSDVARIGGGIMSRGQDVVIDAINCFNIDRPLHLFNPDLIPTTGTMIGSLRAVCYVRGLRVDNCSGRVGQVRLSVTSPNATLMNPGQNGVLIVGAPDLDLGDCWIENAPEHTIRVGGSAPGTQTKNLRIGKVVAIRSNGCVIKINPSLLVAPGQTETCDSVQIGDVLAVDACNGMPAGNREILRITHARVVSIGHVVAVADETSASGQFGLLINDSRDVQIASLGGVFYSGFVNLSGTSDVDGVNTFAGPVLGLRIGRLHGSAPGNNAITVNGNIDYGDVHIHIDGIKGFTLNVFRFDGTGVLQDIFLLTGWVSASAGFGFVNTPANDNFQIDLSHGLKRVLGRASGPSRNGAFEITPPPFANGTGPANGLIVNSSRAAAGNGLYGGAIEFTRLGSARRACAIVPRQGSADDKEVGLDFFVGDSNSTANEAMVLALSLLFTGRLQLSPDLVTYADNAAALAAGLAPRTVYWTPTGEMRIAVAA